MDSNLLRMGFLATLLVCFSVAGCEDNGGGTTEGDGSTGRGDSGETPDPGFVYSGHNPVWLDEQNWTRDESTEFYFKNQGSELVPYEWFLTLEQADSTELFRSDEHLVKLGYITQPKSRNNPDALPIGFVLDDHPETTGIKVASFDPEYELANHPGTEKWLGFNCAACHTADITYKGTVIRIDGGPAMIDHESFLIELAAAMRATLEDDAKFERFRVANSGEGNFDTTRLKPELQSYTAHMERLVERNAAPQKYGFARLDAFGAILNEVTEAALGIRKNRRVSDAPVSFPFLWYASKLDFVQWNRSADNAIARNVGEVMGVYAHMQLQGLPTEQFQCTADFKGLARLETLIEKLKAPMWPENILGKIDQNKAKLGARLFAENCNSCHPTRGADGNFPMTTPDADGHQFIITKSFPPQAMGTDPKMVMNFLLRTAEPGALKPYLSEESQAKVEVPAGELLIAAVGGVIMRYAKENQVTPAQLQALGGHHPPKPPGFIPSGYISRPLYGIWATAPYLHNGSVPNLYELLLPDTERSPAFYVGSREFDPEHVGFITTRSADRSFKFEAVSADGKPVPGNMNTGHSGPTKTQTKGENGEWRDFTDDERWALVEYMKTLN